MLVAVQLPVILAGYLKVACCSQVLTVVAFHLIAGSTEDMQSTYKFILKLNL